MPCQEDVIICPEAEIGQTSVSRGWLVREPSGAYNFHPCLLSFRLCPALFLSLSLCLSPPKSPWRDHSSCLSILMQAQRINKPGPLGHKFLRGAGLALCIPRVCIYPHTYANDSRRRERCKPFSHLLPSYGVYNVYRIYSPSFLSLFTETTARSFSFPPFAKRSLPFDTVRIDTLINKYTQINAIMKDVLRGTKILSDSNFVTPL